MPRTFQDEQRRPDPFAGLGAPRADEAERYVLGCLLQDDSRLFVECQELRLRPTDFFSERHKAIAQAIWDLNSDAQPSDLIAVSERLRARDQLTMCGGLEYLQTLVADVASTAALTHHAKTVQEKSLLRSVILADNESIFKAQSAGAVAREVLAETQQRISDIAREQVTRGLRPTKDLLAETIELIDKFKEHDAVSGTVTGFSRLDNLTTGLHEGELIILAARPGMGKTAFALSLALNAATNRQHPFPVAFFSLEMDAQQLMLRLLCTQGHFPMQDIRKGRLAPDMMGRLGTITTIISEAPLYIDDQPDLTLLDLRTKCRMLKDSLVKNGTDLGLIVLDYLQLVSGGENAESRQVFISQVSRGLKQLAKELRVPVLALSQLSRKIEDRPSGTAEPKLSDLRESGAIEQDADMVWFIARENKVTAETTVSDEAQDARLIVAKHRNGPTDSIPLVFVPKHAGFYEPSDREPPSELNF